MSATKDAMDELWDDNAEGLEPPERTVTCSPCCGLDVTGTEVGEDETVAQCPGCGRIVEGCTVEVPVSVVESGPETVMAWIQAHRGRTA